MGGAKATVTLRGRPLIYYPLQVLRSVLVDVAIVAKVDTELPILADVAVWIEPSAPRHPLVGIVHAIGLADGRPVLVCAADLPFVTAALVTAIVSADPAGSPAVVPSCRGELQPLLAMYRPAAAAALGRGALEGSRPLRQEVAAIGPALLEVEDGRAFFNVNTPEDLLRAAAIMDGI